MKIAGPSSNFPPQNPVRRRREVAMILPAPKICLWLVPVARKFDLRNHRKWGPVGRHDDFPPAKKKGGSRVMGVSQKRWLVFFMENPTKIWMIGGYPYFRKAPYDHARIPSLSGPLSEEARSFIELVYQESTPLAINQPIRIHHEWSRLLSSFWRISKK